jgi:glucokinase
VARMGSDVLKAAAAGDNSAIQVVSSAGEALGAMVGLLINVLDPEAVVVGGGVGLSEGLYWDSFVISARRHIWSETRRNVRIAHAQTGQNAGVIGAAAAAWKHARQA